MIRFFSSLRFRLLLLVLLALIPALGLVIYTASEQRQSAAIQAKENALRVARVAASHQEQLIEGARELVLTLAQLPAVRDGDPVACRVFLANLLKQYPHYLQLGVAERDGTVFCTAIPDSRPVNIADGLLFRRILETQDFAVGEYLVGLISGKGAIAFGYPLFDETEQVRGVVFASMDLGSFNELAAQALMPPGSTLTMRDRSATIIARYPDPEKWIGKSESEVSIVTIIQSLSGEGTAESIGVDNVTRLYAFTPLRGVPENDIYISVGIPTAVAYAEVNQILARNLVALGLVAALAFTVAWVGGDLFLLRRVNALLIATKRLAEGDLTARTGLRYGIGELSQLARAFDQMSLALEQRETGRKQAEERIRRWSAQLESLINVVAEAISQPRGVNEIAEIALTKTLGAMDLPAGCVFFKQGEDFVLGTQRGLEAVIHRIQRFKSGGEATREIARMVHSNMAQNFSDAAISQVFGSRGDEFQTWVCVPIKSKGHVLGAMCLGGEEHRLREPPEQSVLFAVGQLVGVAIENAELYDQVQSLAALKERERLSRELHDGLAQVLGYLYTRNKIATDLVATGDIERAGAQLQEMQRAMQEAYQDIREAILDLRVTVSANRGLVSALKEYLHKFGQQTGIRVNLISNDADQFECAPEADVQLLRIIQEALANVRKHSEARQAWIRFEPRAESMVVTIEDNGKGFDSTALSQDGQQHFGLQTMQERAESVGGSLQIQSQPGQGTKVMVTLALDKQGGNQ